MHAHEMARKAKYAGLDSLLKDMGYEAESGRVSYTTHPRSEDIRKALEDLGYTIIPTPVKISLGGHSSGGFFSGPLFQTVVEREWWCISWEGNAID